MGWLTGLAGWLARTLTPATSANKKMTERTLGLVEAVEDSEGHAPELVLRERAAFLSAAGRGETCAGASEFGPMDLCYVAKAWRGIAFGDRAFRRGFYHYVAGLDTSIEGACAYFSQLGSRAEPSSWWRPAAGEWVLEEAVFCFYAPFTCTDIQLRIRLPGSIVRSIASAELVV